MTLRVLGRPASINVRKVLWTCSELDLPFELVSQDAALLARNPNGLVPVIQDGDFVLWESNAICRYLATQHPRYTLLPADPRARALIDQWMDWQATQLNTAWRYAFLALVRQHPDYTQAKDIADSIAQWHRHMKMLDDHFAQGGQFLLGEHFTLADVVLGLSVHRWLHTPIERPALDAVQGYYQRLSVRPAFRVHNQADLP